MRVPFLLAFLCVAFLATTAFVHGDQGGASVSLSFKEQVRIANRQLAAEVEAKRQERVQKSNEEWERMQVKLRPILWVIVLGGLAGSWYCTPLLIPAGIGAILILSDAMVRLGINF
jgi:hypothetical protein